MQQYAETHLCEFTPSPSQQLLFAAAEKYVVDTEAFDRTVCTGPIIRGSIMPATSIQRFLINRNARKIFGELLARNAGHFTAKELAQEIGRVEARHS